MDNFSTGYEHNLEDVRSQVSKDQWSNFTFIQGDIRDLNTCRQACQNIDYVLHLAALRSVPRSIEDPIVTNQSNIDGFVNILVFAWDTHVKRFVYAASKFTYGDHPDLPKKEDTIGKPLFPYAVTKYVNELYADVFAHTYGMETIGLRYFHIFGRRQDPNGAYAAVIPKWFAVMLGQEPVYINGDGETSRDFCYIENCVKANLLAATTQNPDAINQVYNVAFGQRNTLNELFSLIQERVQALRPDMKITDPVYCDFPSGGGRHSLADISKPEDLIGYKPLYSVQDGLDEAAKWYVENLG